MTRLHAAGDMRGTLELNSRANVMIATLLFPLLAFSFVFAEEIVAVVYTAQYLEAAPVMRVYALGLVCMAVEIGSLTLILREGAFAMKVGVFVLAGSVALSWYAGRHFGLAGAAVGSVAAIFVDRFLMLRRIAAHSGVPVAKLQDWRGLGIAFAFAVGAALLAWLAVRLYLTDKQVFVRLAAGAAIIGTAYFLPLWRRAQA
jgi:O-antigen/teichoic acid export membrane protein